VTIRNEKVCFVISPIGDDESPIREEADAILWIIRQALEKYDFRVVRVDEVARTTVITNEIVQLIQESALAVIVLTSQNPNVFYEAGRRHETGKPFIQMIKRGESIPFDVAGIKTIIYDAIETLSGAARTIGEVQRYVDEFEKSGYGTSGAGVSLSTIAVALDRIERKVAQMSAGTAGATERPASELVGFDYSRSPRDAFMGAIATGNITRAAQLLPHLESLMGPGRELVAAAGYLARAGNEYAAERILAILEASDFKLIQSTLEEDEDGVEFIQAAITSLVRFFDARDREQEGLARLEPLFKQVLSLPLDATARAFIVNQIQMLCYGAKDYERALQLSEETLTLNPGDAAYVYNASLLYEKMGLLQKTLAMVDRYMESSDQTETRLSHAVQVYVATNQTQKARKTFERLRELSKERAAVLLMDREIRAVVAV
jgi:tetratricopeptide (TPR) repeat protein